MRFARCLVLLVGLLAPCTAAAAPQAPPDAPIRLGPGATPPTKIRDVKPVYPAAAQQSNVTGVVIIEAVVGEDGKVRDARVLRSIPLLDQAALDAVRQWAYTPTVIDGKPRAVVMTVTVNFSIQGVPTPPPSAAPPSVSAASPAPGTIRLFAYRPTATAPLTTWDVAADRANRLPRWNPETDAPALTVADATRIARAWVTGRYPRAQRFDLQAANLLHARRGGAADFWYYQLTFVVPGTPQSGVPYFAVVLPDGSIAEPSDVATSSIPPAAQPPFSSSAPGVTPPRAITQVNPQYTEEAVRRKITGTVAIEGIVDTDGAFRNLRVVHSLDSVYGLDAEAMKAAAQWQFVPGTKDGQPVPVTVTIELAFTAR